MKRLLLIAAILLSMPVLAACNSETFEVQAPNLEADVQAAQEAVGQFEDGIYTLDTQASNLYWEAFTPVGGHRGKIFIRSGEMSVSGGNPSQGSFMIDMGSIQGEGLPTGLLNHLASDDFFSVATYPTARFDITRISPYEGGEDYNFQVEGDLSIRDITKPIIVYTKIAQNEDGLTAKGMAMVERTQFDITIRSGSFFEGLGDKLIKDEFLIELDLLASKSE